MTPRSQGKLTVDDNDFDVAPAVAMAALNGTEAKSNLFRSFQNAQQSLEEAEPLDGNIYKYFAFRNFMETKHDGEEALFTPPKKLFDRIAMLLGLAFVMVIQIIAPIALLSSNVFYLREGAFNPFRSDAPCWSYQPSQWLTVILSQAFLFCFILFSYKTIVTDKEQMEKIFHLALLMEESGQTVCKCVLYLDALVNSYTAVFLSLSMFTVLFKAEDAQSVIMDSLGLAFVLNIDDLSSDLGFLGDVWDPSRVGKFYAGLNSCISIEDAEDSEEAEETSALAKQTKDRKSVV